MELILKSRNGKISDRQREHIEGKLAKLERYLDLINKVTVEVSEANQRGQGVMHRVQATVVGERGILLRAEEQAADLYVAIDAIQGTLQRQIQRYKDKHWRRGRLRRQGGEIVSVGMETTPSEPEENLPRIVRTKEFAVEPMFSDEAVEQMELLGHAFFVFRDAETSQINVLYRRKDGDYGLIVPETAA
jgi:ribosomal subunit interface protein